MNEWNNDDDENKNMMYIPDLSLILSRYVHLFMSVKPDLLLLRIEKKESL